MGWHWTTRAPPAVSTDVVRCNDITSTETKEKKKKKKKKKNCEWEKKV